MIKEYPVSVKDYTKEEAPYIYTKYAEEFAKDAGRAGGLELPEQLHVLQVSHYNME